MDETPKVNPWIGRAIEGSIIVLAMALGLLIRSAWLETAIVTSDSMRPTLSRGTRLLIDHRQSLRGNWARGDMVLFEAPQSWSGEGDTLIKRIIGLPGETVAMRRGIVSINGVALNEKYVAEAPEAQNMYPLKLAPRQYWMMGDNRNNSDDSRNNGPLPNSAITGRAIYGLSPLGALPNVNYN